MYVALVLTKATVPPFPVGHGLNVVTMNWACLIFGAIVILSIVYYMVKGRHVYDGPVAYVRKDN